MGSISETWFWLIRVPFLGWIVLAVVIAAVVAAALVLYDAYAQYRDGL